MPIPAYLDSIAGGLIPCQALEIVNGARIRVRMTGRRAPALGFAPVETFATSQIIPRDCVRRGRYVTGYSWAERFAATSHAIRESA